jgi:hypothetical protein
MDHLTGQHAIHEKYSSKKSPTKSTQTTSGYLESYLGKRRWHCLCNYDNTIITQTTTSDNHIIYVSHRRNTLLHHAYHKTYVSLRHEPVIIPTNPITITNENIKTPRHNPILISPHIRVRIKRRRYPISRTLLTIQGTRP